MPASSTQYGTTQPSGSDPYQIENVLAKIVGENNPAEAANMLDVYQTQRIADTGNYNYALGQQHDFAKEQLAQQLKETYLKEAMQAVQHRGGTSVYNQLVGPENAINPTLTSSIETGLTDLQNSTTAKNVGDASYLGLQGGLATDPGLAGSMTGGFFSGSTMPLSLQKEAMVQDGANKRHAADAGKTTVSYTTGITADGRQITIPTKVRNNATDDELDAAAARTRNIANRFYPQGSGVPGIDGPAVGSSPANPNPTGVRTNLAPASTSRASAPAAAAPRVAPTGGAGPQAASGTIITDPRTQGQARVGMALLPPQAKNDVLANTNHGAMLPIFPLVGGGVGYQGKSGTMHVLPQAGSH